MKTPQIDGHDQWFKSYTAFDEPDFFVLRNNRDWMMFWGTEAPGMLPDDAMAIVVCLGQRSTGGYGVKVTDAREENGNLVIDAQETRPQGIVTQAFTAPLCVKLLEKTDKPVVVNRLEPSPKIVFRPKSPRL
jgi:hypothetical protein